MNYQIILVPVAVRFVAKDNHTIGAAAAAEAWLQKESALITRNLRSFLMQAPSTQVQEVPDELRLDWMNLMANLLDNAGLPESIKLSDIVVDVRVSICMDVMRNTSGPYFWARGDYTITVAL